jgi:hypothetical protein
MSNKFTIIQQANNEYLLKYDMGLSYYKGVINVNVFCVELQSNYVDVVKEAIKYFLVESKNEPKIMSMFQYPETSEVNNFMISFEMKKDFINIQRLINIEMFKITKTIDDYMFELDYRIKENSNLIKDNSTSHENKIIELEKKNLEYENEIKKLKETVDLLTQNVNKLLNSPKIENASFNNPSNLFLNSPTNFKEIPVQQSKFSMPPVTNNLNSFQTPKVENNIFAPNNQSQNNNLNSFQTPKVENNIFTPNNQTQNNSLNFNPLAPVVKTDNNDNIFNIGLPSKNSSLTLINNDKKI